MYNPYVEKELHIRTYGSPQMEEEEEMQLIKWYRGIPVVRNGPKRLEDAAAGGVALRACPV